MQTRTKETNMFLSRQIPWLLAPVKTWSPLVLVLLAWHVTSASESEKKTRPGATSPDALVVHEWGTFTELQEESGNSIVGINTDDEPVPPFVHQLHRNILQYALNLYPQSIFSKGIPFGNTKVKMRLETPVTYFYLPDTIERPITVDVEVLFRGGWISEYFPNGTVDAPGMEQMELLPTETGSIRWNGLRVGAMNEGTIPETNEHVWLAPRIADAARVVNTEGEAEGFLFYRGVGNFEGPLEVLTDVTTDRLTIRRREAGATNGLPLEFRDLWLVDVRLDNTLAFRKVSIDATQEEPRHPTTLVQTTRKFADHDYHSDGMLLLHDSMHESLVQSGLTAAEATAMLETWKSAYFESPGLRLFYIAPRGWVDQRLPIQVRIHDGNLPVQIERVMIGRVELVTQWQRDILEVMKREADESTTWRDNIQRDEQVASVLAGRIPFAELGFEASPAYQRYLDLGRFRNALVRREMAVRPTDNLLQFARQYGLLPQELGDVAEETQTNSDSQ